MNRNEMKREIDRIIMVVDLMDTDLSKTQAKASVNRSKLEGLETDHLNLRNKVGLLSDRVSSLERRVSKNLSAACTDVDELRMRMVDLERVHLRGSGPVSLAACSQAAEHGWELGRRSAAREIRDELHLGASWSEFRDWIGREYLGE